jgi:hypothetical protein
VLLVTGAKGCGSGGNVDEQVNEQTAITACENSVKAQLKAPSTAGFSDEQATKLSAVRYAVSGFVDAENSFGAKIRNAWSGSAVTRDGGKTWRCVARLSG